MINYRNLTCDELHQMHDMPEAQHEMARRSTDEGVPIESFMALRLDNAALRAEADALAKRVYVLRYVLGNIDRLARTVAPASVALIELRKELDRVQALETGETIHD